MYISNSVQSMDTDVLKEIKRKNLTQDELEKNKEGLRGIRQEPEIIVPLPNETKTTFFNGLNKLFDSSPNQRFAVFQTLILTNTEMAHGTTIKKFGLEIKHKQHHDLIGRVGDKFVCETERVVASTKTISTNEYLECRVYSMLLDAILRFQPIHEIFRLLDIHSINYSKFSMALYNSIDLESAEAIRALDGNLNALINLGLGKGDWWSGEDYHKDRVGPGKGQRMDTRRAGYVPGIIRYINENN